MGDLLLEVHPPDDKNMNNNKKKYINAGLIGQIALMLILSNPAYATDFLQCEAIARRRNDLTKFYFELQNDAKESIKKGIVGFKCGEAVESSTLADLQIIGECKKSLPPVNYGSNEEYKKFDKEFLAPIREKLNKLESESKRKQCI